jgi:hypothetical protein
MEPVSQTRMRDCCLWLSLTVVLTGVAAVNVSAEIVFQDFFTQSATNVTNSVPWINVEGTGWQSASAASQLALDGSGHLYNAAANAGAAAGVQLIPIGPHGSMTASATVQLPTGFNEWIGMGFGNSNQFLTSSNSGSGPWMQVFGTGTIDFYGGAGQSNQVIVPHAFTNSGDPIRIFLAYDAFHATASVGTVSGGVTNLVFNQWPVTNSAASITAKYLLFQFSTNLTTPTARWAAAATVDWLPRPPPMLTLPVPIVDTLLVGAPGTNDIELIQSAFNQASGSTNATEIRFTTGATYVLTNASLTGSNPVILLRATNVLVNGNGCEILIANPRIGFLDVNKCSNVLVQGFTVDYNPLPFTQGVVTHNFYTGGDVPKESAIEFLVDTGYPAPTNANYVDADAVNVGLRWGMVIDTNRPGRVANGNYAQCFYTNVVQTNSNGAFKVYLTSAAITKSIEPGSNWCMISRWNSSINFQTFESCQVTYLSNTNYAGAGASFAGQYSPLTSEINDYIQPGPPPDGATAPRLRASNADGGLFIESRIGPWVQGCNFSALSDDTANACLTPFVITNAPAQPTNTFALFAITSSGGTPVAVDAFQAQVGDLISFFNVTNGVVFDRATITAVDLPNITFDHAISNIVAGTYDTNTLVVDESLNTSAVYLDNQFGNSAFHGIYCRANNMLIAHNTVSGMGYNDICAFPAINLMFLNFFVPTNVVIMDNVLSDGGFSYESVHNTIPTQQPTYALVALNKAELASNEVTNGLEISGIRILYNAFLDWRRAPLTLHNATDVNIIGNYFGPPVTDDGWVPLTNDIVADLWSSDYPNLRFTNNVNATTLPDDQAINEDGVLVPAPADAFLAPAPPVLAANLSCSNLVVSWVSPSPGFVLQQINELAAGSNNWLDVTNAPCLSGESNIVTVPFWPGLTNVFFRTRQQ